MMPKFALFFSLLLGCFLSIVLLSLFSYFGLTLIEFSPSMRQADFVRYCGSMNDMEYTVEHLNNLSSIEAFCFNHKKGQLEKCNNDTIVQLQQRNSEGIDPFFTIYQDNYDNSWSCKIEKTKDKKIKAMPIFLYE